MQRHEEKRESLQESVNNLAVAIAIRSLPLVLQTFLTTDLTIQQLKVLSVIVTSADGVSIGGLVNRFGVSMASMSKLLDRLVAAGLTTRVSDPGDHRVRMMEATPLGRAVVRELMATRPELGANILARLSVSELQALETGLGAISREMRGLLG
ncbi:MarR family transcriptional regulator [Pseudarthrobacter sp. R1]|uniref:MarR family winged helix-turn-helix transcriptional regulator n=1 Tax=Pseudarthrobacter sp. R1 TaxID=2944934 RepID=UPI00210924B3|nr:MarR family transcriptional regulator [Pseudarthrobacter sp. R1]MCQ6271455.1 MarR family transcriptional regulator [Pseudarthrobacter sp. R1]